ncbi:MAG: class I adenylate-forming enzyme family protein [Microthrixaceae bacterium]
MSFGLTVGAVIANAARGAPHATAAVIDGRPHAFTELDQAGDAVAQRLVADGGVPGQVALVLAATSFSMLAHYVGCARAGLTFAPMNPGLDQAAIGRIARRISPSVVLASPECAHLAPLIDAPSRWHPLTAPDRAVTLPDVDPEQDHIAFFTSGSTGDPKAAVVSHRASVLRSHPGAQLEPRGPALCPWPLFHMAGWTIGLQQWHARSSVVFVDGTDAETLTGALRDHHIERFNAIPALWSRLAEQVGDQAAADGGDADVAFPHLRFADTGTSRTSVALLESIASMAPNAHVRVFYGSSEAGNVASLHHEDLRSRPGSCGRPSVLTEVSIADDGELLVRGPLLFERYLGDPEASEAAWDGDWYRTGDRAEFDDDGYLSIVGRVGTVIRTGGESVAPEPVEAALVTHESVDQAAVFGVPDERWGEVVCAAVVATQPVTLDDLRNHLSSDGPAPLAKHQRPRRLLVVDELPRTSATGQIDRGRLRELANSTTEDTPNR